MAEHDSIRERGRALEEEYFRKREQEIVERIRKAKAEEATRSALGAATGLSDPDLVTQLADLGFTPDTVVLLPLVPVLQIAWAEGGVSASERDLVWKLARSRGITDESAAGRQLAAWLEARPADALFASAGRLVAALLDAHSVTVGTLTAEDLIKYCEKVAAASGGMLGLGRTSLEEKELLASLAKDIHARR